MYLAEYLLSIREFMTEETYGEALVERAFSRIDDERKRKAQQLRPGRARAASLGAGLLLQLAVGEALDGNGTEVPVACHAADMGEVLRGNGAWRTAGDAADMEVALDGNVSGRSVRGNAVDRKKVFCENGVRGTVGGAKAELTVYSVSRLLDRLEELPRQSFAYRFGENGKPYFRELPFYFSLSHSGDYVFCALSTEEIGADIQQHGKQSGRENRRHLADRFFSEEEKRALEASGESEELFYRLWTRKEAYGKLTGEGVAGILRVNLLPEDKASAEGRMLSGSSMLSDDRALSGDRGLPERSTLPEDRVLSEDGGRAPQEKEESARERILPPGRRLVWKEYGDVAGYSIAVCHATSAIYTA